METNRCLSTITVEYLKKTKYAGWAILCMTLLMIVVVKLYEHPQGTTYSMRGDNITASLSLIAPIPVFCIDAIRIRTHEHAQLSEVIFDRAEICRLYRTLVSCAPTKNCTIDGIPGILTDTDFKLLYTFLVETILC